MPETALICRVPEAERYIAHYRQRFDPSARRNVPAHVTILYPFMAPPLVDAGVLATLAGIARSVPCFNYRLAKTERFPVALYLAPEPGEPFSALTDGIFRAFPDYPPFEGKFEPWCRMSRWRTAMSRCCAKSKWSCALHCRGGSAGALLRTGAHRELERPMGADARLRARRVNSSRANRDHRAAAGQSCLPALHRSVWRATRALLARRGDALARGARHARLPALRRDARQPMNTPPEKCRYDACVELPRGMTLPDAGETTFPVAATPSRTSRERG